MDITNQYDPLRAEVTNAPEQANAETAAQIMGVKAIGEQQINELMQVLTKYRAGKNTVDSRIIAAENGGSCATTLRRIRQGMQSPVSGRKAAGCTMLSPTSTPTLWMHTPNLTYCRVSRAISLRRLCFQK